MKHGSKSRRPDGISGRRASALEPMSMPGTAGHSLVLTSVRLREGRIHLLLLPFVLHEIELAAGGCLRIPGDAWCLKGHRKLAVHRVILQFVDGQQGLAGVGFLGVLIVMVLGCWRCRACKFPCPIPGCWRSRPTIAIAGFQRDRFQDGFGHRLAGQLGFYRNPDVPCTALPSSRSSTASALEDTPTTRQVRSRVPWGTPGFSKISRFRGGNGTR